MSYNNRNGRGFTPAKKVNKFAAINQAKGFGQNRNKVIWDSGNAIQWIAAKDLLKSKFESEGVFERLTSPGDDEVTFTKVVPTVAIYVTAKLDALREQLITLRDAELESNVTLLAAVAITQNVKRVDDARITTEHAKAIANLNTNDLYRLTAEYDRAVTEYDKSKKEFNENTAKVIKVFNESL
jgi:hypothetical protein